MQMAQTADAGTAATARQFLLIDDHPIVRDALGQTLADLLPGSRTDLATSLDESRRRLSAGRQYDYLLLDLELPDAHGLDTLVQVRQIAPETPIIVVSGETSQETIAGCLEMGVLGYIPKSLHSDVIRYALRLMLSGQIYIPREALALHAGEARTLAQPAASQHPRALGLTGRQVDVLRLMMRGLPNKLICRELQLAEGTVKVHVSAILRALAVSSRTQAVVVAHQLGIDLEH